MKWMLPMQVPAQLAADTGNQTDKTSRVSGVQCLLCTYRDAWIMPCNNSMQWVLPMHVLALPYQPTAAPLSHTLVQHVV
jgi:hypothetical protein